MKKTAIGVLAVVALFVAGFMAVRYTRAVGERLTSAPVGPIKISFIKDPVQIPELTMQTLDGRTLTNKDLAGKVVLVNFWATWCPPCREEIPDLIRLQDAYKDELLVIGISSDEGPTEMVAKFAADNKMNYPIVMETAELARAFPGVYALPTTFIVDREQRMVKKHVGLVSPALVEAEARVLANLPVEVEVEHVADTGTSTLSGNAQATEVPGLDLDSLGSEKKTVALKRLNEEMCGCGCGLTIAQCRINDPSCAVSLPMAEKIVEEIRAGQ